MANFPLRRANAARFLATHPDGWFGWLESRAEGRSATELVECRLDWKAPLFGEPRRFLKRCLPPQDLNDREHGKDHLCSETNRSGRRFVGGKLIHQRSTEYGTKSDLSRHQHQERDEAHQ